jgi:hypothetical protein
MDDLQEFVKVLESITDEPYTDGLYTNSDGAQGYTATYRVGADWYWYSVSGTVEKVRPQEVAIALREGRPTRASVVKLSGYEATINHQGHSYMVNRGSA